MSVFAQVTAYIISPLATLLAVWVAYLALLQRFQPQLLIYYRPNPDTPTMIDLIIENIGGGNALDVTFSAPLPINRFNIGQPHEKSSAVTKQGFPAVSPGQRYIFIGGQYAGLSEELGTGLSVNATYSYRNPIGFSQKKKVAFVLGIEHLKGMPTRTSANEAIVDALKGPNKTTLQEIRDELRQLNQTLLAKD
ncbi:hypothetical protein [Castellaniella sp.]|uniref:hypothetical protein n=1 Tax=Castellaniella sp. TaxID=1955812 RepID=UPI002AFED784|nr:hypothetical protein [Castellaniella sp.]